MSDTPPSQPPPPEQPPVGSGQPAPEPPAGFGPPPPPPPPLPPQQPPPGYGAPYQPQPGYGGPYQQQPGYGGPYQQQPGYGQPYQQPGYGGPYGYGTPGPQQRAVGSAQVHYGAQPPSGPPPGYGAPSRPPGKPKEKKTRKKSKWRSRATWWGGGALALVVASGAVHLLESARPPGYDLPAGFPTEAPYTPSQGGGGSTESSAPQSPTAEAPKGDAAVESRTQLDKAALALQDASQLGIKYYDGKTKRGDAYSAGLVTVISDQDGGLPVQSKAVFLACAEKGAPRFKITVDQSTISMSGDPVTLVHSDPLNAVVPGAGLCTAVVLPPLDHEFPDASAIHGITIEDQDGKEVHILNESASANMVVNPMPSADSQTFPGTANFNQAAKKSAWKNAITNTELHQKLTQ